MRVNGSLQYAIERLDGDIDELGNPVPAIIVWSEPVPCSIATRADNRKAKYVDGEYHQQSYDVLIECCYDFRANIVKLTRKDEYLGEFQIISKATCPSFNRVKIVV